tara:strand:- start:58750 stop:62511 length:3762 start_codon:yes stop_codon:yes gene_type:complete
MSKRLDIRSFPLLGSQLIEASAGTGKTFTIALLYTRLILQHGDGAAFTRALEPEEILVVTFTDAATQELKDRIRARLAEAARCFMAPQEECDVMLQALRDDYTPGQWPGCARRLMLAAQSMDQAAVSTIHGWCYRMLREHAFDSGSLFQQTLITNQQDILAELMRDYWRQQFYVLPVASAAQVLKAFSDPEALLKAVKPLINKTDSVLTYAGNAQSAIADLATALQSFAGSAQRIMDLQQRARDEWAKATEQLEALLDDYRQYLNGIKFREAKFDEDFAGMKQALRDWSAGADYAKDLTRFAQHNWPLKKNSPAQPEHPALAAIADLVAGQEAVRQHTGPDVRATILNHASRWLEQALQNRLHDKAELGFDDLLLQLDRALQGPQGDKLAARIRDDFPVAMIDEFQDTDPLQYRIFDRIYRVADNRQDCALIMIGDPKQAIYSFRNADIHTYLAARSATAGRHYNLDRNFRSTQGVVTAINHLFECAERFEKGAFRFRLGDSNPLPFIRVEAQDREHSLILNGEPASAMTLWHLTDPDNDQGTVPITAYRSTMARICAGTIAGYLSGSGNSGFRPDKGTTGVSQPLRPSDIAVLVRSRTEADAIRSALQRHKLASVYLSDRESVFASPEARDVLRWLRACAEPSDERLLRAALGTRSMALTMMQLTQLNQDELHWEQQTELFRHLHSIWQTHGVLPMLRHLMQCHQLPQRMRSLPDGERALTNLLHLAEYLQKASAQHDGEQALIRHLSEQMDDPGDEEVLRLESDEDLIRVVTIHKSKGLEYPLVFLPFIAGWKEIDGNAKQVSIPDSAIASQRKLEIAGSNRAAEAWQIADAERLSEDMRLLYVAMTRATHGIWLGLAALSKGRSKKSALHNSSIGYLLAGGAPVDAELLDTTLAGWITGCEHIKRVNVCALDSTEPAPPVPAPVVGGAGNHAEPTKPAARSERSPAENWWIASYSALKTGPARHLEPERASDDQTLEEQNDAKLPTSNVRIQFNRSAPGLHGFQRGPKPGTFLHNLLEWAAETGFANTCENDQGRLTMIRDRCRSQGWPEEDAERLDGWLKPFCGTRFRLSATQDLNLCELDTFQAELEFLFASHHVSSEAIDHICQQYLLPGLARPALLPAQLNGMVKGFIDLVFSVDGCYYVADWKSNYLGPDDACYTDEAIREEVLHKRYDVQYGIYLLALHRLLRSRLPDYSYDQHIGGAVYFFLRGWQAASQGLLIDRPSQMFIDTMDALFSGNGPVSGSQEYSL